MRKSVLINLIFILFIGGELYGQIEYLLIDDYAQSIPDSTSDYKEIAQYLTDNFIQEEEKVRALYIWITHNIKYDLEQLELVKTGEAINVTMVDVIKTKKGICQDYSELFAEMCKSIGIESYVISGVAKQPDGTFTTDPHAWNAIRINNKFYLFDLTWSAGYVLNKKYHHKFRDDYFLKAPKDMILTHLPFDPIWQFLDNPISLEEFIRDDYIKLTEKGNWIYADSIIVYENLDNIDKAEGKITRMKAYNLSKDSSMLLKLVQIELDYSNINLAIDYFNKGIAAYNVYINHRNNWFRKPKIDDTEIEELISEAKLGIEKANEILKPFTSKNIFLTNLASDLKEELPERFSDLRREEDYLKRYLNTWRPLRIFVL